jgi:hypothetical protein
MKRSFGPTHIYQNYFGQCMMSFAFGGPAYPGCEIYFYRNIVNGQIFISDHGGPPWDGMYIYQNTILSKTPGAVFKARGNPWYVMNNIISAGPAPEKAPGKGVFGKNLSGEVPLDDRYRPAEKSLAIDAGDPLPAEWPDPLRNQDQGKPDIGAVPARVTLWEIGRPAK